MSTATQYVTERDFQDLRALIDAAAWQGDRQRADLEQLAAELRRRKVLPADELPPDVVTLNSRVQLFEPDTGETFACTLVLPKAADMGRFKISVLSPVGLALFGHRVGDLFDSPTPAGPRRLEITAMWYQPETVGDVA